MRRSSATLRWSPLSAHASGMAWGSSSSMPAWSRPRAEWTRKENTSPSPGRRNHPPALLHSDWIRDPIRAQDKSFEVIRIVARNGDPDVAKDCGPVGVEQRERRSRSDFAVPTYLFRIFWYPKRRLNSLVSMANWWQVLARLMRRYDGPKPMTRAMIRKGRGASCVSAIPLSPVHVERPVSPVRDGWLCQALHKCC